MKPNKLTRTLLFLLLIILIASALYIVIYYLLADDIADLRALPTSFLIVVIVYILAQLIKRLIQKDMPWYNRLYYIGLAAIILPLPFFSVEGHWIFSVTRYGALFLLLPPVMEFFFLIRKKGLKV